MGILGIDNIGVGCFGILCIGCKIKKIKLHSKDLNYV